MATCHSTLWLCILYLTSSLLLTISVCPKFCKNSPVAICPQYSLLSSLVVFLARLLGSRITGTSGLKYGRASCPVLPNCLQGVLLLPSLLLLLLPGVKTSLCKSTGGGQSCFSCIVLGFGLLSETVKN